MLCNELDVYRNNLICIQDNYASKGAYVLKDLVTSIRRHVNKIHVLSCDRFCSNYHKQLYGDDEDITIHRIREDNFKNGFMTYMKSIFSNKNRVLLVIDSLSSLLLYQDFYTVYRDLHTMMKRKVFPNIPLIQIVAVIHEDTLNECCTVIEHMKLLSTAWIDVKPQNNLIVSIVSSSGAQTVQKYKCEIDKEGRIIGKMHVVQQSANMESSNVGAQPVSTFKLTLTDEEKAARQNVKLPFVITDNEKTEKGTGGGSIFYEPDEYDDWDEEEPDEEF